MSGKFNNPICGECRKKIYVLEDEFTLTWHDNKIFHKACYKDPVEELKKAVMESYLGKFLFWTLDRLSGMINWIGKIVNRMKK